MDDNEKKNLSEFSQKLGYEFNKIELLQEALTHRSFLNEVNTNNRNQNERLEFLGDAVLELVVTRHLFDRYPNRAEGDLTSFRAAVVRTESLAETSTELGVGQYIYMSRGEEATGGRTRPYILANTFEALLGAMYLDGGFDVCQELVERILTVKLDEIVENRLDIDPKSKLQEITQEKYKYTPIYETVDETGPDHERIFTVQAIVNDKALGQGRGKSKQEAEQNAAKEALKKLRIPA